LFTAFMNLLIFALFYLLYRFIKSRIYTALDKEPVNSNREWFILPIALFMFVFVATDGFTWYTVSDSSVSIPFSLSQFYIIPFKEVYLNYKNYEFYHLIYGQTNTFYDDVFLYQLKDYIRLFTSMLALGFTVSIVNKTFIKSLLTMLLIRLLLGLMIGEAYIATSLSLALIAFLIAFFIYKILYRGLVRKNFLKTFAESPVHRAFVIGYLIAICLMPLYFVRVDSRWSSDHYSTSQFIDFNAPIVSKTYDEKIDLRAESFRILNKEALEIEFTIAPSPVLDIPYKTSFEGINIRFALGDAPIQAGTDVSSGTNRFRLTFDSYSYGLGEDNKQSIYPLKIYGITSLHYIIDDKRFTNQLKVLDQRWWTNEDGFDCYTYTYQVPKLSTYEVQVVASLTYDNPNPNRNHQTFENKAWANATDSIKIGSTEAYDIYSVDNYFYDYEMGPLKKAQIQGLDQNFFTANVRVNVKSVPSEPIWSIESIEYFEPYLE